MLHYLEACPDLPDTLNIQLNLAVIVFLAYRETRLRDHYKALLPFSHKSLLKDLSWTDIDVIRGLRSASAFFVYPGGYDMCEPLQL